LYIFNNAEYHIGGNNAIIYQDDFFTAKLFSDDIFGFLKNGICKGMMRNF